MAEEEARKKMLELAVAKQSYHQISELACLYQPAPAGDCSVS